MPLMQIPLEHVRSNPFRDLGSDPLDEEHVETLRQSILENGGWWGGVVARPRKDGTVEIACGEHRVEAARRTAMESVAIMVSPLSDHEMVRHLASENQTQRSAKPDSTVMLGAVAAAVRLLVRDIITGRVDESVVPPNKLKQVQGQLSGRHGLGRDVVLRYMRNWPGVNENQVRVALETIKRSGRYAAIAAEVARELASERKHVRQARSVASAAKAYAGKSPIRRKENGARVVTSSPEVVAAVRKCEPLVAKLSTAVAAGQHLDKDTRATLLKFTRRLIDMLNADKEARR